MSDTIRTLVVEDEPPIRRAICAMIEKTDPAFSVVASEPDGERALERFRAMDGGIDVLFTDIRMPVMNGLVLMERVREAYPEVVIVALSGYQDFAYAAHAIRMRAFDYLLKPLSEAELAPLLARIRDACAARRHARLQNALSERISRPGVTKSPSRAEGAERLGVALLCAGAVACCADAEMCPGAVFWNSLPLEQRVADGLRDFASFTWVFLGNSPERRIVVFEPRGEIEAVAVAETLYGCVREWTSLPVTCVCAPGETSLSQVGETIRRLDAALNDGARIGVSALLRTDASFGEEAPDAESAINQLAISLRHASREQALKLLSARLSDMEREGWTQRRVRAFLHALTEQTLAPEHIAEAREALDEAISAAISMPPLANDLVALLRRTEENRAPGERARLAAQIEQYLKAEYPRHITNQTLSDAFGYVPGYLSLIFRGETGMSPSEYLTRVRLGEAKRIMRERPDLLIKEIADMVGFKSPYHFSKTFKRYEGVWPSNYR